MLSGILDPCCTFQLWPSYLLLKLSDESFMHRKLKNRVEEYIDEISDKRELHKIDTEMQCAIQ